MAAPKRPLVDYTDSENEEEIHDQGIVRKAIKTEDTRRLQPEEQLDSKVRWEVLCHRPVTMLRLP